MKTVILWFFLLIANNGGLVTSFVCDDGEEIEDDFVCDDELDCKTGEDELQDTCYCPNRIFTKAIEFGYIRCKKSCISNEDCNAKNKRCLCDGFCGYSCINPKSECRDRPELIPGSVSFTATRFEGGDWRNVEDIEWRSQPTYIYKDRLTYQCEGGREYIANTTWCTSAKRWSNNARYCALRCDPKDDNQALRHNIICGKECYDDDNCDEGLSCACDGVCGRSCSNLRVECGDATAIPHTTIRYSGNYMDKLARYSCDEGYFVASGDNVKTCTSSGRWFGTDIVCERVECGDPLESIYQGGGTLLRASAPYYVNDTVEFDCPDDKVMLGAWIRTCMQNGQWSGELTVCDNEDNYRCNHPGYPINGDMYARSAGFGVRSIIEFECDDGYILEGEAVQECTDILEWTGDQVPICTNPKYSTMSSYAGTTLSRFTANIDINQPAAVRKKLGRKIQANVKAGHEIYFLFDTSNSMKIREFKEIVKFAKRVVERVSKFNGSVIYGIYTFSTESETVINATNNAKNHGRVKNSNTVEVLKVLDVLTNYTKDDLTGNTNTAAGLDLFRKDIALNEARYPHRHRNLFVFTDGKHNIGENPVNEAKKLQGLYHNDATQRYFDMYSVTACSECVANEISKNELTKLASKKENFIFVKDYQLLHQYMDKVTDIKRIYQCGKLNEKLDRNGGKEGAHPSKNAWPWQALVTKDFSRAYKLNQLLDSFGGSHSTVLGGGSLIGKQWVLTAAHLFPDDNTVASKILVSLGVFNRSQPSAAAQYYSAAEIIKHPEYRSKNGDAGDKFDIALIKLGTKYKLSSEYLIPANDATLDYSPYVHPICLPCSGTCFHNPQKNALRPDAEEFCPQQKTWIDSLNKNYKKALVIATGFGKYEQDGSLASWLKEIKLHIQPNDICLEGLNKISTEEEKIFLPNDEHTVFENRTLSNHLLCARNDACNNTDDMNADSDTCQGDSGGPLIKRIRDSLTGEDCFVQIGIVSFGLGCGKIQDDGLIIPGFYTNVHVFLDWIWEHTGLNSTMT